MRSRVETSPCYRFRDSALTFDYQFVDRSGYNGDRQHL
jgi:hypothetical protein